MFLAHDCLPHPSEHPILSRVELVLRKELRSVPMPEEKITATEARQAKQADRNRERIGELRPTAARGLSGAAPPPEAV
jgi:hypothetical protein